jgi:cyclophilin family peptidyl-prolyl cis-trans isomerase/protein-disulfide isomerase
MIGTSESRSSMFIPLLGLILCLFASCTSPTGASTTSAPIPTPTPGKMECTILPYPADVKETMAAFLDEFAHVAGSEEAPVTILMLTDFQCPGCKVLADSISVVQAAHSSELRLIVRYLPDGRYDKSTLAMQAAEAAHLQGRFWEMYTFLFDTQAEWYSMDPADFPGWLHEQASALSLDMVKFDTDFIGEEVTSRVQQASQDSASLGLLPPILFINSNSPYNGMADVTSLDMTVRLALLEQVKFHTCPDWSVDPTHQYIVRMQTSLGEVALQLYPEKAPLAVNNFIYLIRQGWYDNSPFHSVEPGFVIQTGDPSGTGYGNPGYYFPTELAPGLSFSKAGMLAMANAGSGTNGSLFFITYAAAPQLDGQFTIFGEVLTGMEILETLHVGDQILSMSVEER